MTLDFGIGLPLKTYKRNESHTLLRNYGNYDSPTLEDEITKQNKKLRKYEIYDPPTLEDEIDNNRGQC